MSINEGILLCKHTGELVGFEDMAYSPDLNMKRAMKKIKTNMTAPQNYQILLHHLLNLTMMSMTPVLNMHHYSMKMNTSSKKAKLICQFFFSSLEGHFLWPVASYPLQEINNRVLSSSIVWQVCE